VSTRFRSWSTASAPRRASRDYPSQRRYRPTPCEREPLDYWIANFLADVEPEELERLARLRWRVELD
jgi:hypothetical protein